MRWGREARVAVCVALLALAACSPPEHHGPLTLRIDADGGYQLGDRHLADEMALKSALRDMHAKTPDTLIVVEGGKGASYMQIARAMADLQASGETKIGIIGTEGFKP